MQAYSSSSLYNKYVNEQASEAFYKQAIGADSYRKILQAHPVNFYTPNYFIRIALGILTIVAVFFSVLLMWLISGASGDAAFFILFIFSAIVCYTGLELFVKSKHYYNAGIDNVLMCLTTVFMLSAFLIEFPNAYISISACMFILCLWLCLRFIDGLMALLSYCALLVFVFFVCSESGETGKAIAPFILMIVSAIVYFIMNTLLNNERLLFYKFSCKAVLLFTLLSFYACGNYFVVNELRKELFPGSAILIMSWLFWIFTILIPAAYFFYGILKRDMLFMRTGIVLLFATIFTIRYYYTFLPAEIEMLAGGLILIAISWLLIRYLHKPKHGFSFNKNYNNEKHLRNIEALIIAQAFGKKTTETKTFEFGGGSSGGGGATGNY